MSVDKSAEEVEIEDEIPRGEAGGGERSKELISERYRGIRPAPGYPACSDHTSALFDPLGVEKNAGIQLTETFAMFPASSVSGLYFAHPEARYFSVGKIGPDQVADYQIRKGFDLRKTELALTQSCLRP